MSSFRIIIGHVDPAAQEIDIDYLVEQRGLIDRFARVLLRATGLASIPEVMCGRDEDHHYLKVTIKDVTNNPQQTLFGIELQSHVPDHAGRFFHREAQAILVRFLEREVIPIGEFVEFLDRDFLSHVDVEMARILREMPARRLVIVDDEAHYAIDGRRLGGLAELPTEVDIEASVAAAGRKMVRIERIRALNAPKGLRLPGATSMIVPLDFQRHVIDALYLNSHARDRVRLKVRVRVPKTGGAAREVILVGYSDGPVRSRC